MDKINVAVIGTGAMGKNHARVYSEIGNAELVAVCDANKERAKSISDLYNANCYTDYKEMLKKEKIEAASVCVPTVLHKQVATDVIKKKVNVLVEKPIAAAINDAREIINEAEKNKVKLMVGHIERFNPVVIELKKRIRKNQLGKIYNVHCARMGPTAQRITDVGVIIDLAIHEIDILKHLINSKIKRVYAETAQRIHSTHEDMLIGTIRFENGVLGVINSNWLTPKIVREISVAGENGMFVADYFKQELYFYENEFARRKLMHKFYSMMVLEGKKRRIKIKNSEPLKNELVAFVGCCMSNGNVPITGNDGLDALYVAQKFIESSKKNEVMVL
ncbi:Gfo/Idh/MocA family oxidoreductase [Candidatus Woesearchaeota archaeon]|nr:Gfo/Idh/MocA family oxidoreductase [Candidatus Woesearchaeota archaeon]